VWRNCGAAYEGWRGDLRFKEGVRTICQTALPRQLAGASSQKKKGRAVSSHKYVARFFHVLGERLLSGLA